MWNLETVRTLALVNSAGLAGVSAIYASDSAAKVHLGAYPSAALFAFGLVCSLLNMYANSQGICDAKGRFSRGSLLSTEETRSAASTQSGNRRKILVLDSRRSRMVRARSLLCRRLAFVHPA